MEKKGSRSGENDFEELNDSDVDFFPPWKRTKGDALRRHANIVSACCCTENCPVVSVL